MSDKLKIGISVGDINGIGLEVILKTLSESRFLDYCTPIVYGNTKVCAFHRKALHLSDFSFNIIQNASQANPRRANLITCWEEDVRVNLGVVNETGGKYAWISLKRASEDLVKGNIDALVTAPINKHNIQSDEFRFPGHTEFLDSLDPEHESLMFLIADELRVGTVTGHIPVTQVAENLSIDKIVKKIELMHASLKRDFWIEKPKIAVLGLNPHASDQGLIGKEEAEIISPAIQAAFDKGIICFGPYPADGFFGNGTYKQFDAVLGMYHDQALIPFKTIAFNTGVNFTAGLKFVRTSPDHGTGMDIAGKGKANPSSFVEALFAAIHIAKNRIEQDNLIANQLRTGGKMIETASDVKDDAN